MELAIQTRIERPASPSKRYYPIVCSICGKIFTRRADSKSTRTFCSSCDCKQRNKSGADSPAWKGGHKYYQEGRNCADPNGYHWKIQKPLSIERDNNTCQSCYNYLLYQRAITHHIISYEFSMSHALSNLITVCDECHESAHRFISATGICPFGPWLAMFLPSWDNSPPEPYMGGCPF